MEFAQLIWSNMKELGVLFAGISAFLAFRALRANYDWNRRKAAMDAVIGLATAIRESESLVKQLPEWFSGTPIPLTTLLALFKESPDLEIVCKRLLDVYENLATGVLESVYDENVVRKARRTDLTTMFKRFEPYIMHQRQVHLSAYHRRDPAPLLRKPCNGSFSN